MPLTDDLQFGQNFHFNACQSPLELAPYIALSPQLGSGYFGEEIAAKSLPKDSGRNYSLSQDELYIGRLLFHFQTGIQYNLHAVYQVKINLV